VSAAELVDLCKPCINQLNAVAIAELRSDHAGETGAVYIYQGILAVSRSKELQSFAEAHIHTEQTHLATLDLLLPKHLRSRCLPLWRIAGWMLGAFAAFLGPRFTYATIRAVETFVVEHYQQQLHLYPQPIRRLLQKFCADEDIHRSEAHIALPQDHRYPIWSWIVARGSASAVSLARRI
jgi:ubiquinone biosynthesis monooxygenase Coq7